MCAHDAQHIFIQTVIQENKAISLNHPVHSLQGTEIFAKAEKDIEELVSEVTGMFAGGELSEDAIEGAYKALTDAYWIAKENNKKYAPKRQRSI